MQAQITLVPYDEPGKSGTKSIVFEYEETDPNNRNAAPKKVKKEFDMGLKERWDLVLNKGVMYVQSDDSFTHHLSVSK